MCDAAQIEKNDVVLEIGPGTGALTRVLLERGAKVIALEADLRALAVLEEVFKAQIEKGRLILHHADARSLELTQISGLVHHQFKVVANIPYYLSGLLFRTMLESEIQPKNLVFLVQKEVAKRICVDQKRGEKESLLSLSVKVFGTPHYIKTVSRGHFSPAPKVDSGIIAIEAIHQNNFAYMSKEHFFDTLHIGFGQKRKQLMGNLSATYQKDLLIHIFSTLGLSPTIRAEDVSLEKWLALCTALRTHLT
jgi:16S rRNA (adenine1518-N6/adenine1519-N6)-dimethyltransferase